MINKKSLVMSACGLAGLAVVAFSTSDALAGRGNGPIIYVQSQGLFYDSIVTADPLPQKGPFQKLEMGGASGLMTMYGPGDPEYKGGRWWVDLTNDGMMNDGDHFFSCPLLGPGRDQPEAP